jgi:alpha-galactosidase
VNQARRCRLAARTGSGSQPRPLSFPLWVTILLLSFVSIPHVKAQKNPEARPEASRDEIVATYVESVSLDAAHPAEVWKSATPIVFSSDWQGQNADSARETSVRVLWSRKYLYLRFECHYRELFTFEDSDPNGRRDHLWDRDVAEAFLQPDPSRARFYREFEVSPNGMWIDLDIFPGGLADLKSGLQRSVAVNEKSRTWSAELAIPMKSLTENFDSTAIWRANFYRVEGKTEPRAYLAWQPTKTPQPNFHVPSAFGSLRFAGAK